MSKPRYNWWGFAMAMIRDYPDRDRAIKELRKQKITADTSGAPGGRSDFHVTEAVALRCLPKQEQWEYDAVNMAINRTKQLDEGKLRLDVIKLTMWRGMKIDTAAFCLHVSDRTARRYRWQFIMMVGLYCGWLSEEEYTAAMRRDIATGKKDSKSQNNVVK